MTFSDNGRTDRTAIRYSGCYLGQHHIHVGESQDAVAGIITLLGVLPSTGRASHELTLRPGLTFHEGITISSPVDDNNRQISAPDEL
jgi:hypothetical protein